MEVLVCLSKYVFNDADINEEENYYDYYYEDDNGNRTIEMKFYSEDDPGMRYKMQKNYFTVLAVNQVKFFIRLNQRSGRC